MFNLTTIRARLTARVPVPPPTGRQFWLEREPMPEVLPGQGLAAEGADRSRCQHCAGAVHLVNTPGRGFQWQHADKTIWGHAATATEIIPVNEAPTDDDIQLLVADGPRNDDAEREALFYRTDCQHCDTAIHWRNLPEHRNGGYWSHATADRVDHNAEPRRVPGYTEQPPQRIEDAMAKFEEAVISGTLAGPTPLADELRADREALLAANGRLVARVRALEAQLREHGIEPLPAPASARS